MPIVHMCLVLLMMVVGKDNSNAWKPWKQENQRWRAIPHMYVMNDPAFWLRRMMIEYCFMRDEAEEERHICSLG